MRPASGHVFWYTVEGGGLSLRDCARSRTGTCAISSIPCPASPKWPASAARFSSTRSTSIRTVCAAYALPLSTVVRAVMASNSNVGGNVVSENGSWSIVRGLGLIENLDDIRNIVVASHNGTPVFVKEWQRPDRRRISDRRAGQEQLRSRRRRGRGADRREHEGSDRPRKAKIRRDRARPATGRADRSVLRPIAS